MLTGCEPFGELNFLNRHIYLFRSQATQFSNNIFAILRFSFLF